MQPIYLNTYKIYIQNAKVMKKNESAKKKRDYFALSLALAKKKRLLSPCPHVPMSPSYKIACRITTAGNFKAQD